MRMFYHSLLDLARVVSDRISVRVKELSHSFSYLSVVCVFDYIQAGPHTLRIVDAELSSQKRI